MIKHNTGIEWTHIPGFRGETWNPVVGCSIASKGCTNCYAMRTANVRLDGNPKTPHYAGTTEKVNGNPVWTGKVSLTSEKTLLKPLSWREPRSIFVNSMGDLFHEDVPVEWIDKVFATMVCAQSANHKFIILTKRAERMHDYFNELKTSGRWLMFEHPKWGGYIFDAAIAQYEAMTSRIWLGVSTEDQATANERIPFLIDTPATVRFASCEPLLGTIDLENIIYPKFAEEMAKDKYFPRISFDALRGHMKGPDDVGLPKLDWVIAGGESGPNARPMHTDWARSLRDQCQAANVPFFFKQWGEWLPWECGPAPLIEAQNRQVEDRHNYLPDDWDDNPKWDDGLWGVDQGLNDICFEKTGKKKAGHLLDGVEHFNWPECVKVLEGVE